MSAIEEILRDSMVPLLRQASSDGASPSIAFHSTGGREQGRWIATPDGVDSWQTEGTSAADLTVSGEAEVLVLFCLAALDVQEALASGALRLEGDLTVLERIS